MAQPPSDLISLDDNSSDINLNIAPFKLEYAMDFNLPSEQDAGFAGPPLSMEEARAQHSAQEKGYKGLIPPKDLISPPKDLQPISPPKDLIDIKSAKDKEGYFESGFLGRFAKGLGERIAALTMPEDQVKKIKEYDEARKELDIWRNGPAPETPGIGESLSGLAKQAVEHPLDTVGDVIYELGKDPELFHPALWRGLPAKLAAVAEKAPTAIKVAGTGVRGAAVGAAAEAGAQSTSDQEMNLQQIKNTAAMFGTFGAATHGAIEVGKGLKNIKNAFVKDVEVKEVDPLYQETKMKPEESVSETIYRNQEAKKEAKVFKTTAESWAEQADANKLVSSMERNRAAAKENASISKELETLKENRHRTIDESLRLASLEDEFSINLLKHNPEEHLLDFKDQLIEELQDLKEAKGTKNEWPEYDSKRIPVVEGLLKKIEEFQSRAEAKAAGVSRIDSKVEEAAAKPYEMADAVKEDIAKADEANTSTLADAATIIGQSMNDIRAESRLASILSNYVAIAIKTGIDSTKYSGEKLEKAYNGISSRITRALEGERKYDRLYTDKEKQEAIYGTGEINPKTGYPDEGMLGAIKGMSINIEKGKLPKNFKGTMEEYVASRDRLALVTENWSKLPSEEHAIPIMKEVKAHLDAVGKKAEEAGVLRSMLNNYVTHVLDFSKSKMSPAEQKAFLDKIFNAPKDSKLVRDFSQHRVYDTLRALEKAVEGTGVVVHTDIAKILEIYTKSMQEAIIHKKMIEHFKTTVSPDGKPWLMDINAESSKLKYQAFQGKGAAALDGLAVHPDLVDTMKFMFEQNEPELILRAVGAISHLTKALNTVGSFFHAYSLSQAHLFASPGNAIKQLFTLGAGIRHAVNEFRHNGNSESIDGWIRAGLMAGTEDIKRTIIADIGKTTDDLLSKFVPVGKEVRAVQHLTEPFDKYVLQKINAFTWDYMHTGQKINLAEHLFAKAKTKNPAKPDAELRKEISEFVNTTFGGLNWLEVASQVQNKYLKAFAMKAAGIRGRGWAQILLFAPDWTVSTLRSFTNALPRELAKPQNWQFREGVKGIYNPVTRNDFARRYVLNTAIGYFTILNGINMATSGHPIWENHDPARIDLGDGTSMQAAKHSMEVVEWVRDPTKTFGNKLGFIPKSIYIEISGHAYPSITAPKLKPLYEGYGGLEAAKAKAILTAAMPFQVGSAAQAPKGQKWKRAIHSTLGIPIYGQTKEQQAKAISEAKAAAKLKKIKAQYGKE
jgi:predicted CopG family antitoxin